MIDSLDPVKKMGVSGEPDAPKKVVFCIPTTKAPFAPFMACLEREIPLIKAAGWDEGSVFEIGNVYISVTRAIMLRKALDAKATVIVFLDHDMSWKEGDLLKLIETEGHVVAGTYRFKHDEIKYMGKVEVVEGTKRVIQRADGCIKAQATPAGFLKITREAVNIFIEAYPALCYGERCSPHIDLFHQGAEDWVWWGEDYAFTRRWNLIGEEVWIVPDLDLDHWGADGKCYEGNFLEYMLRQPNGAKEGQPMPQRRAA